MKRLKHYLLNMDNQTTTYKEIYEGEAVIHYPPTSNLLPEIQYDAVYWHEGISYAMERTHKQALDKPTLTIQIPCKILGIEAYTVAAADQCLRQFSGYIKELNELNENRKRPDAENGKYFIYEPGGEVLCRNAAYFAMRMKKYYENGSAYNLYLHEQNEENRPQMNLCIMVQVQLPAKKLRKAVQMLCKDLPEAVQCFIQDFEGEQLAKALRLEQKQQEIREWLKESVYCAFVANGSILPREKGTQRPLSEAIPFLAPLGEEIEVCGMRGMGVRRGVTVITGGGYSGKSTLLDAISAGIYNHTLGDGRELVITDERAIKIAAEDGRSVKQVNISPFIKWLPGGETGCFSTAHASGSTSQAANIMEAVNAQMKLLLIDEDKSATNFMIRDHMMKALIEKEPITPFTDRVRELYENEGVSTILVIGGSGEYLAVADQVYKMDDYVIEDVTERAKVIGGAHGRIADSVPIACWTYKRLLRQESFTSYPEDRGTERLEISDMGFILIGDEQIDIRMLHHVVSKGQLTALGFMLRKLAVRMNQEVIEIEEAIAQLYEEIEREGIEVLYTSFFTTCERFLDVPRPYELISVINRMRKIQMVRVKP